MQRVSCPPWRQWVTLLTLLFILDIPLLLSFYEIKLALLVTISQSRVGAAHVTNAGLFPAIRASGLFSVDPDIGIGEFHVR